MMILDQLKYVPQNYPEVAEIRKNGCNLATKSRIDYGRKHFCNKWANNFECICPNTKSLLPKPSVLGEISSLDYYSAFPLNPTGVYPGIKRYPTMAQKLGLEVKDKCPKLGFNSTCPGGTNLKVDFISGDSVCGSCAPSRTVENRSPIVCDDDFPGFDISSKNMPFRVCFGEYPSGPNKPKIRSGAERCLHPSQFQDIRSVTKETYLDFTKTKTAKELSLYRTPQGIDHRRARQKIIGEDNGDIRIGVNNGPLFINARPTKWKSCGNRRPPCPPALPDFQICVSGPIVLP